jgi:hypothetical protein
MGGDYTSEVSATIKPSGYNLGHWQNYAAERHGALGAYHAGGAGC